MLKADLSRKTAMVTGASSGFGVHFARVLAQAGAHVIVAARRIESLQHLVDDIIGSGGRASAVQLDVTSSDSITAAFGAGPPAGFKAKDMGDAGFAFIMFAGPPISAVMNALADLYKEVRAT